MSLGKRGCVRTFFFTVVYVLLCMCLRVCCYTLSVPSSFVSTEHNKHPSILSITELDFFYNVELGCLVFFFLLKRKTVLETGVCDLYFRKSCFCNVFL